MSVYMHEALRAAETALANGEVPVGAVVVKDKKIVSVSHNRTEEMKDFTFHAELCALRETSRALNTKYLNGCEMYVTLEPCTMCAGAIMLSRISRVYFGAYDTQSGAFGSVRDVSAENGARRIEVYGGINEKECAELMKVFFTSKR